MNESTNVITLASYLYSKAQSGQLPSPMLLFHPPSNNGEIKFEYISFYGKEPLEWILFDNGIGFDYKLFRFTEESFIDQIDCLMGPIRKCAMLSKEQVYAIVRSSSLCRKEATNWAKRELIIRTSRSDIEKKLPMKFYELFMESIRGSGIMTGNELVILNKKETL